LANEIDKGTGRVVNLFYDEKVRQLRANHSKLEPNVYRAD
jgi:hypothetical protein